MYLLHIFSSCDQFVVETFDMFLLLKSPLQHGGDEGTQGNVFLPVERQLLGDLCVKHRSIVAFDLRE